MLVRLKRILSSLITQFQQLNWFSVLMLFKTRREDEVNDNISSSYVIIFCRMQRRARVAFMRLFTRIKMIVNGSGELLQF